MAVDDDAGSPHRGGDRGLEGNAAITGTDVARKDNPDPDAKDDALGQRTAPNPKPCNPTGSVESSQGNKGTAQQPNQDSNFEINSIEENEISEDHSPATTAAGTMEPPVGPPAQVEEPKPSGSCDGSQSNEHSDQEEPPSLSIAKREREPNGVVDGVQHEGKNSSGESRASLSTWAW